MNKGVWAVVFILVATNCLTLGLWFTGKHEMTAIPEIVETATSTTDEVVATVGNQTITHQDWLNQLEKSYGEETLKEIINREVIYQLADKYSIQISDEDVEQELIMIKAMYNSDDNEKISNQEEWKEQIKYNLLLEKVLTRDVTIPEENIKSFYLENQNLYQIPKSFHLSHIRVKTKGEADTVLKELEAGSDFGALAMEKSIDEFTASQGGDIGYVTKESGYLPKEYEEVLSMLKVDKAQGPIQVGEEYAVLYLYDVVEGKEFTYEDIKEHIQRQLALGQIEGQVTAEDFWAEIGVNWFYGKAK